MGTDSELLAQFERKSEQAKAVIASADAEAYEAFKVFDRRQLSLHICPVNEPLPSPKYSYMLYTLISPSGKRLDLVFSFMLVTITGRNLFEVRDAVANERCAFLQQFDAKQWAKPKDDSAPFIESINYLMNLPQASRAEKDSGEANR